MLHYQRSAVNERVFIPPGDARKRVKTPTMLPYGAVAHLNMHYGENMYVGTGFLFKRESVSKYYYVILTAAHNLYHEKLKCYADEVHIYFGRDGQRSSKCITKKAEDFRVPKHYIHGQSEGSDFGIIYLDSSDYEKSPLGYAFEPLMFARKDDPISSVVMSGYPGVPKVMEAGYPGWPKATQWEVGVNISKFNTQVLEYKDATTGGNSGSPLYTKIPEHDKYVALGIHVAGDEETGYNSATRITMDTLTRCIDRWLGFDDDDWVYYPWVDSPWLDVNPSERRKTWCNGFTPEQLAERAECLDCNAFNTGGAIKTHVLPKMKWVNLFSYDSQVIELGWSSYGMWVKWEHAKNME